MKMERNIATMFPIQKMRFVFSADVMAGGIQRDTTTLKQGKYLVNSNLLYNFRFMMNSTNGYVFPSYISFHDKLDTTLTHSSKDEEMMSDN